MRITILLLNEGRGSGEVARQQARHLIEQGHKVNFIHPRVGEGVRGARNVDVDLGLAPMPVHEYLPSAGSGQVAVSTMTREQAEAYLPAYEHALESVMGETELVIGHHANLTAIAAAACRAPLLLPQAGRGALTVD